MATMQIMEVQLFYLRGRNAESMQFSATMRTELSSNRISRDLAKRLGYDTSSNGPISITWRPPHRLTQYHMCDIIEGPDAFELCEESWRPCCATDQNAIYPVERAVGPGTELGRYSIATMGKQPLHCTHD